MKSIIRCLLFALTVFSFSCGLPASLQSNSGASFNQGSADLDSQVESLRRRLGYVQSKLGIYAFDCDFAVPAGKKLVATLVTELDGEVKPGLSVVFHIPPTDKSPDKKGGLSIYFFNPVYPSPEQDPKLELEIRTPQVNSGYGVHLPYRPSSGSNETRSGGTSSQGLSSLEEGKDYEVWVHEIKEKDRAENLLYHFKCALKIRLEKLAEGEVLDNTQFFSY